MKALKSELHEQFEAVLLPQRIPSGWRIDPGRLRECLLFLYYWLPEQEWWRIYGDACQLAKRKNCVIALGNLNNCQRLWDVNYQSPADLWSVAIFHGSDDRFFLESNIGKLKCNVLNLTCNGNQYQVSFTVRGIF